MEQCPNCDKPTGHKRALGWGTFFAVILTGGLWLIAIPWYDLRCIVCGAPIAPHGALNLFLTLIAALIGIMTLTNVFFVFYSYYF